MKTTTQETWVIVDQTSNHGIYIDHEGKNTELPENAMKFESENDACDYVIAKSWQMWACVIKIEND